MKFDTNKEKGNSGLIAAIGYYGMLGYTISLPLNDTQDYDLIVDNGERILKVQVKATAQRSPYGYTVVNVCSTGGTKGAAYKTVKETNVDILFVLTELQEMYEIPIQYVTTDKVLVLGPDRQHFRVDSVDTFYFLKKPGREKQLADQRFCSNCGKSITSSSTTGLCVRCVNKLHRVVERPTKEQLLQELQEFNFTYVARKYGVSDNTIRKWCKNYGLPSHAYEIKNFIISDA